jgi:hypothetical protein
MNRPNALQSAGGSRLSASRSNWVTVTADSSASTLGWPTVCGFVPKQPGVTLSSQRIRASGHQSPVRKAAGPAPVIGHRMLGVLKDCPLLTTHYPFPALASQTNPAARARCGPTTAGIGTNRPWACQPASVSAWPFREEFCAARPRLLQAIAPGRSGPW